MILRDLSIIIADDHPVLRNGLRNILEREAFVIKVDEAENGQEVVNLLQSVHYDIVLMDIRMTPMCGLQTTKIIQDKYSNTKVIAFSMFNDTRYVKEMKDAGACGYLLKSASKSEIINAIQIVSSGGHFFCEGTQNSTSNILNTNSQKENGIKANNLREIIYLLCLGKINKEIAAILDLSPRTVEKYRNDISDKLVIKNIAGIIRYGIEQGILDDEALKIKFAKYSSK